MSTRGLRLAMTATPKTRMRVAIPATSLGVATASFAVMWFKVNPAMRNAMTAIKSIAITA